MDHDSGSTVAAELTDWYWKLGVQRRAPYALGPSDWLRTLYDVRVSLGSVKEGLERHRPAMAIWGPSQTGKSTSVSAYLDAGAKYTGDEATDGEGSGLHWPGGVPFFFMAPRVADLETLPSHLTGRVINPYNKGMDGSSCLSRFLPGSTEPDKAPFHVSDPMFPVELYLVTPDDLWHAIARGFSTECVTKVGRRPGQWSLERFSREVKTVLKRAPEKPGAPDRDAYERLHALTGVLDDLAQSDDPTFEALGADGESWQAALRGLFEEPRLMSDASLVDELAARIFWEGAPSMTDWYNKMAETWRRLAGPQGQWHGKRVLCSLDAAGVFLNMGACVVAYQPRESNPQSPAAIIQDKISKLSFEMDDEVVRIGCTGRGEALGATADDFSVLQGLVWELVIPINLDNLPEKPFPDAPDKPNTLRDFLNAADLLDFPGVGNETKAIENRIVLDEADIKDLKAKAAKPDATPQDKERAARCFSPQLFFKEIVKRGKTASIVSTYAKRLSIDGFSIFQGLRGYACPNADQLINGIKSWWKHLAPDYFAQPQGESPYPLNLVLTWWARQLNLAVNPNDSNIYGVIDGIVNNLGRIKEPEVCVTFAIHDHASPDRDQAEVKLDFAPGSERYNNLHKEKGFARQFHRDVSKKSFDAMVSDTVTGGAEFFFAQATEQMQACRSADGKSRLDFLNTRADSAVQSLLTLLATRDLVPQPKPRDDRKEHLERFRDGLRAKIDEAAEEEMLDLNFGLRELLNIRASDLLPIPRSAEEVNAEYVEAQFRTWAEAQSRRFENHAHFRTLVAMTGLQDQGTVRETTLALGQSVAPDYGKLGDWLVRIIRFHEGRERIDLGRLLALRMGNAVVRGNNRNRREPEEDDFDDESSSNKKKTSPYRDYFVAPFAGEKGQLDQLITRQIKAQKRPDQAGDAELAAILKKFESALAAVASSTDAGE